jgi:hypothetical protein
MIAPLVTRAQGFIDMCASDSNCEIAGGARREIESRQINNTKLVPLTSDVMKLNCHLKETQQECISVIDKNEFGETFSHASLKFNTIVSPMTRT